MKKTIKALMAVVLFCLPLAFVACGSDDDDNDGPKTWTYKWEVKNNDLDGTTEEKQARLNAENKINVLIAAALQAQSGVVNASTQTAQFVNELSESQNDSRVKSAWYSAKSTAEFIAAAADMASNAKVAFYRNSKKILEESVN